MQANSSGQGRPVALITGCSSGIGRATARLLAQRGWYVFATARRPETLADLVEEVGAGSMATLRLDVTDEGQRAAAVEAVMARAGRIDALVNNAGYTEVGPLEEATDGELRRQFETCAFGPLRLAQLVLPTMRAQGSGRIVNVSSIGGRVVVPFIGLYGAAKFSLEALSDALRNEVKPFGVDVIIIEPGSVKSNFNDTAGGRAARFKGNGDSPYRAYFEAFNRFVEQSTAGGSPPAVIAQVIHRALTAKRPRARYPATTQARVMLKIVPHLTDRMRDAIWRRMLKV